MLVALFEISIHRYRILLKNIDISIKMRQKIGNNHTSHPKFRFSTRLMQGSTLLHYQRDSYSEKFEILNCACSQVVPTGSQISELFLFLLQDLSFPWWQFFFDYNGKGSFWGYQKWHLGCPNQNSERTFIDQNHPQNPQKDTLGTQIGPRKVIFSHFFYFVHFPIEIPIVVEKKLPPWEGKVLEQKQKQF